MASMKKQITVRVSDSEFEMLGKVAEQQRLKRSDIVRLALFSKLPDETTDEIAVMSDEQHEKVMLALGDLMTMVSTIKRDNALLGSNVNQIARIANETGEIRATSDDLFVYNTNEARTRYILEKLTREVDKLWRTLR